MTDYVFCIGDTRITEAKIFIDGDDVVIVGRNRENKLFRERIRGKVHRLCSEHMAAEAERIICVAHALRENKSIFYGTADSLRDISDEEIMSEYRSGEAQMSWLVTDRGSDNHAILSLMGFGKIVE